MPQSHVSKFADRYKRKSGGIDKRALRGLRRSLDRKQSRSELVGQRRKIMEASAMSPVDESRAEAATTKANSQQQPTKADSRLEMLMKWKKEKELKKKMEMAEQAKKKPFRVVHIETEVFPFQKNFTHSFKTGATSVQKTASVNTTRQTAAPVTNSRTGATASQQPQPATDRMLRSASTKPPASAARLQKTHNDTTNKSMNNAKQDQSRVSSTSRAGRPTSGARITRSQTQVINDKRAGTSVRATVTKSTGSKSGSVKAATAADKSWLTNSGSSKQGRSNILSHKSDAVAAETETGKSKCLTKSAIEHTVESTSVQASEHVEDMDISLEQTNHQYGSSPKSKSARRMDDKENYEDRTSENVTEEDDDVFTESQRVPVEASSADNYSSVLKEEDFSCSNTSNGAVHDAKVLSGDGEERLCCNDESKPEVLESFRSPGRSRRARSTSTPSVTFASIRKTPKNLRNSLLLRGMSPEEGVEFLKQSPMIEMNRRKSVRCHSDPEVAPMPSFDDLDKIVSASGIHAKPAGDDAFVPDAAGEAVEENPTSKVDISYFRNLIQTETDRLKVLCAVWRSTMEDLTDVPDEVHGCIRTTIGQAELLMAERFKQFAGLVKNCEYGTGEKEITTGDLQGFWDMVYFQVEDVDKKFAELDKLQASDWVLARQSPVRPKRVVKKKKAVANGPPARAAAAKPAPCSRSNFAEFRRQMKMKNAAAAAGDDAVTVPSPGRQSPRSGKKSESIKREDSLRKDLLERSLRRSLSTASPVVGRRQSTPPPHAAMAAAPTEVVVAALSPSQAAAADNSDRKPLRSILHNTVIDSDAVIGDTAAHSNSGSCKKMTRKSVCFIKPEDDSSFLKYIEPTELSGSRNVTPVTESTSTLNMSCHSGSPQSARLSGRRSTPNSLLPTSGAKTTGRLVDISGGDNDDEEDVAVTQFGRLKVGFTPGMDSNHRSRRISGFSPAVHSGTPVAVMSALNEEDMDLMKFSSSGTPPSRMATRRQTLRRSCRVSSIARALAE